jgi:amidase
VPLYDSALVKRLRSAGAIVIAKSNMHEFAYGVTAVGSLFGATRNPYAPSRNPGGSSGGTGAAIAANFASIGVVYFASVDTHRTGATRPTNNVSQ